MAEATLQSLVEALRRLPGVGVKSAQRMAFHLLQNDRDGAAKLASALHAALEGVRHCARCNTFTEDEVCAICRDPQRDARQLCVIETPADQAAVERSASYRGLYYVLLGRISPLDGVGATQIGAHRLLDRATDGATDEVIIATNFTAEGEATAHVLTQALQACGLRVTRLARGVPIGSELEYVDLGTIAHALVDRR